MIWHNPKSNPPKSYDTVLVAVEGNSHALPGYLCDEAGWLEADGSPIDDAKVYAWTEMPVCPVIRPEEGGGL